VASRELNPSESYSCSSQPNLGEGSFSEVRGRSTKICRWADVPFPASSKAEAFEACNEKIGEKTIRGPWRFEFDAPTP
jgi:hypothetical protein